MTSSIEAPNPPTLETIERRTKRYADARGLLSDTVAALNFELEQVRRNYLSRIKTQVKAAKEREAELRAAIEAAPQCFVKPRTLVLHGIKVGFRKASGKIEFDDAAQVVKLIRKHFSEQFDVLVKTEETPIKKALANLSAAELMKLGIEVADTDDVVEIKDTASDVEKLVAALLKETDEVDA